MIICKQQKVAFSRKTMDITDTVLLGRESSERGVMQVLIWTWVVSPEVLPWLPAKVQYLRA